MSWDFKREESSGFTTNIPEGKHRVRIKSAEKAVSKTGRDMLVLQFEVSGYEATIYHYIVFMEDRPEITNRMLTQFYDSFKDIPEGSKTLAEWIGKVGAACIKHEEYNGNVNAKISWFVAADKQGDLPPWKEVGGASDATGFMPVPDDVQAELPF